MKFDILYNGGAELTEGELKSVYGGLGGDNGSGDSGVVDALNGVLDGNDIGIPINIVGYQPVAQDVRSVHAAGKGGSDDD